MTDAFDYLESRDDADELIREFGGAAQIRRDVRNGPPYAPVITPSYFDTYAVRVEFTIKQINRGSVREGAERWLVAAGPLAGSNIDINPSDRIKINGVERTILAVDTLSPAGTVVLFDCQIGI